MEEITELLENPSTDETNPSKSLRDQASRLLTPSPSQSQLPQTLHDLLIEVIKPLFSKSHHPSLTSTGRKNLVSTPSLPNRFGNDSIFDPPPPWKNDWTVRLLSWILRQYATILEIERKTKTIEAHFHLLVPPLLHLIDDTEIKYKASGCDCLTLLCNVLVSVKSDILKRTGLAEVFVDALKNCFHYLPSLTPEDESLLLMRSLYPAYLAVVHARFILLDEYISPNSRPISQPRPTTAAAARNTSLSDDDDTEAITIRIPNSSSSSLTTKNQSSTSTSKPTPSHTTQTQTPTLSPKTLTTELSQRTTLLTTLLRHSLLHSLSHLTQSSNTSSLLHSTSPPLTIYLLTQLSVILHLLNLDANSHLQTLIPFLVSSMLDPFASSALEILEVVVDVLKEVVCMCWERVRERWWKEVLRGCVGVWVGLGDDLGDLGRRERREEREDVKRVMGKVERLVMLLGDIVGSEEFECVVETLVREEPGLEELFRGWKKGE